MTIEQWRGGDSVSRLILDMAAGRSLPHIPGQLSDGSLQLAYDHGLVGLLATSESAELRHATLPVFGRLAARQQVKLEHLRRILERFAAEGVRATVLKGPMLAFHTYRDPRHRTYTDLDVLVHPGDLEKALAMLEADPAVATIPPRGPKADKRNVPMADRRGVHFNLDLHWDLFSYTQLLGCAHGATTEAWDQSKGPISSEMGPVWTLPEDSRIAFLCAHALLDHRFRLILFRDLVEVALRQPDWDRVGSFATRWQLRSITYLALLMAVRTLNAAVPEAFLTDLRPRHLPIRIAERLLSKTDLVRFDGHRPHPLNLAIVLLHDSAADRAQLLVRAPAAFPEWKRRVGHGAPRESARHDTTTAVVLVTSDRRRGAEVFGERLASGLRDRGWSAELLALKHDATTPTIGAEWLSTGPPASLGRLELKLVRDLRRYLQQRKLGVVLANGSATLQYAVAATLGLRPRPRVVYSSIGEPLYWIRGPLHQIVQRVLLARTDLVLAVSEATRNQLIEGLGLSPEDVKVAPTGVPDDFFEVTREQRVEDELRLLFLGSLSPEKDPGVALRLASHLSHRHAVKMCFVGEGPLLDALRTGAEELAISDLADFVGSVEDVRPYLAWADLLVLTSRTEGLPGVVLEAAAAGLPTVAFDVGGTAETIRPGITGELVEPGDLDGLVETVDQLATDPIRLVEMGENARRFVQERYGLDRSLERYHALLSEVQRTGTTVP